MARIIVTDDNGNITLDERDVRPCHLDNQSSAVQLLERLAWGLEDAEKRRRAGRRAKRVASATAYTEVLAS